MIGPDYYNLTDMFSNTCLNLKNLNRADIVKYHLLFGWYMNARMYKNTVYDKLITHYSRISQSKLLLMKPEIKQQDKEADEQFDKPHFRLFNNNPYYIEFVKGGKNDKSSIS